MNRRGFLGMLAGAALDPERLVLRPEGLRAGRMPDGLWFSWRSQFQFYVLHGALEIWPKPRNADELLAATRVYDEMVASYHRGGWVKL